MGESKSEFTQAELTASDGRVWTPEECELVAKWWKTDLATSEGFELGNLLDNIVLGWDAIEDPPAVFILRGIDP